VQTPTLSARLSTDNLIGWTVLKQSREGIRAAFAESLLVNESLPIDEFFLGLVGRLRDEGFDCSITGGLACVEYGLVEHTLDCDIIFDSQRLPRLLDFLTQTSYDDVACQYRGNLSAPLDERWLANGWTAHLFWNRGPASAYLDVFGQAPRSKRPWWDSRSLFAPRATVAGMKRTQRMKDWSQATGLGLQMLRAGDQEGWLHIFDAEVLLDALEFVTPDPPLLSRRPVLRLAQQRDPLLERAVQTEIDFWSKLDRLRLRAYQHASKPYVQALRSSDLSPSLPHEHERRIRIAEELLPKNPLDDANQVALARQAKEEVGLGLVPELLSLLPQLGENFEYGGGAE